MGNFWDDFATGFKMPFEYIYDHGIKPAGNVLDKFSGAAGKAADAAGNLVTGAGNAALGLGDLLGGNSNILMYIGLGILGVVVLPVLLDKLL